MPRIALYYPKTGYDKNRLESIRHILREECESLGLEYIEKENDEKYPIVYLEDKEASTFLYIEDMEEEDNDNIRAMIRVLTLVALLTEEKAGEKETEYLGEYLLEK